MNLLNKLPSSARGITTVMALSMPVVMMAGMAQPQMLKYFLGAYVVLGVIGAMGAVLIAKREKKKAQGFSEDIKDNAGSTQGVRDPDKLREVDDLRQQFQRGIDTYKQYGKDLYSLPWYVVVGESGSGKTEALRRSEVGFPDKLQDYWQGTGGTLSMHWWFTNRAVILDTAGRLFVSDGTPTDGPQSQWTSFLQMLRKNRPDCPINGLVLVIPATSLVKLTDEAAETTSFKEIDSKAGQIAKQMEVLQTELGVRFPVYILITKTDRIIGFREFFERVESPEERYQMLGWSNPAPLDQPFNPQAISEHLRETADRLRRRRMSLLKDPVPSPGRKRFDEVDSLFALPSSFEGIAPKLERYLRQIFAVDEWSAKPPFLRGIYFTSALQQGAVLDEALARAVGMSVEQYERGGGEDDLSLARNRSYFLRDFFLEKVFAERGLVVKSSKSVAKMSGWKLWVPLGFAFALLLLGIVGWITGRTPPPELKAWRFLADEAYSTENYGFRPLIELRNDGSWGYIEKPVKADRLLSTLDELGTKHLKSAPKFGWLFGPAAVMDGGVKQDRSGAYRVAVDKIVLVPLLEAALDGVSKRADQWDSQGVGAADAEAIRELVAIYSGKSRQDLDSSLGSFLQATGLPFTSNKNRDTYKTYIGPMVNSVRSAHSDGVIPHELLADTQKRKLQGLVEKLMGGGGSTDLSVLLEGYDRAWKALGSAPETENYDRVQVLVRALSTASEKLKLAEPQLRFLTTGAKTEGGSPESVVASGRTAPAKLAKEIFEEREDALRSLGDERTFNRWQELLSKDEGESEEARTRRQELAKIHGAMLPDGTARNHQARAELSAEILAMGADAPENMSMASAEALLARITKAQERAKMLGMETEASHLFSVWAANFTAKELPKRIGFPLVFDAIRLNTGDKERVLTAEEAAGLSMVINRLSELSPKAKEKLTSVKAVARSIFDLEKLGKPGQPWRGAVLQWELRLGDLDNHDWVDVPIVLVLSPNDPSKRIEWASASNAAGLLAADYGADPQFADNLGTTTPFGRGKTDNWAPIRWHVSQLAGQGFGAKHRFNGKDFGIRSEPPARDVFPASLGALPATKSLTE